MYCNYMYNAYGYSRTVALGPSEGTWYDTSLNTFGNLQRDESGRVA